MGQTSDQFICFEHIIQRYDQPERRNQFVATAFPIDNFHVARAHDSNQRFADDQRSHRERDALSVSARPTCSTPPARLPRSRSRDPSRAGVPGGQRSNDHSDRLELWNITTMSEGAHAIKFGTRVAITATPTRRTRILTAASAFRRCRLTSPR